MHEEIEKLKAERQRIANRYKTNQKKLKLEMKRINTAIRKFEAGVEALNGKSSMIVPRNRGAVNEIERILAIGGAMHLTKITEELRCRGFESIARQSVSGLLQTSVKFGRRFKKIAPATYSLLKGTERREKGLRLN